MVADLSVLVAEPSESLRRLITFALRTVGIRVVEAEDGVEALEKAQGSLFSMIIAGQELPKLNCIDLIRGLRSQQELCRVPVLMVPGASNQQLLESLEAGAQGWIEEPIGPEQVLNAVRRNLD